MVKLFYVSVHYYLCQKFRFDILFQYRFHGRYGVNISHIILRLDTDSSLSSFGGGFELMKAGGDKDGFWSLFESGIQCVSTPTAPSRV